MNAMAQVSMVEAWRPAPVTERGGCTAQVSDLESRCWELYRQIGEDLEPEIARLEGQVAAGEEVLGLLLRVIDQYRSGACRLVACLRERERRASLREVRAREREDLAVEALIDFDARVVAALSPTVPRMDTQWPDALEVVA